MKQLQVWTSSLNRQRKEDAGKVGKKKPDQNRKKKATKVGGDQSENYTVWTDGVTELWRQKMDERPALKSRGGQEVKGFPQQSRQFHRNKELQQEVINKFSLRLQAACTETPVSLTQIKTSRLNLWDFTFSLSGKKISKIFLEW